MIRPGYKAETAVSTNREKTRLEEKHPRNKKVTKTSCQQTLPANMVQIEKHSKADTLSQKVEVLLSQQSINQKYIGRPRNAHIQVLIAFFTQWYCLFFIPRAVKETVYHIYGPASREARRIIWFYRILTFTGIGIPFALYGIARMNLQHYTKEHKAMRGNPESNEIDVYSGNYSIPVSKNKKLIRSFVRVEPRRDFFGGKPGFILFCEIIFIPICFLMIPGSVYETQKSLNSHWEFHKKNPNA